MLRQVTMIQTVRDKNRYESPLVEVMELHMEAVLQNGSTTTPPVNDDGEILG